MVVLSDTCIYVLLFLSLTLLVSEWIEVFHLIAEADPERQYLFKNPASYVNLAVPNFAADFVQCFVNNPFGDICFTSYASDDVCNNSNMCN